MTGSLAAPTPDAVPRPDATGRSGANSSRPAVPAPEVPPSGVPPETAPAAVAVGALFGLAWAAGLRGYMVALAGQESAFGWAGTFAALLLPGAVTGALLGWAEYLRRTGGRRHWRWLALAPLALAIAPLLLPGAIVAFLTQGLGGGAVAFALTGMAGGFALSRRGSRWARLVSGLFVLLIAAGVVLSAPGVGGDDLALTTPRGAWAGLLGGVSVLTLAVASSIPHRPVVGPSRERAAG
ncbi:hypothetical protein [Georgenia daeguensis]|uniref:Uncharacterized protein n=1 Tax=Georgenia daeguensis TaxID=908355 RepID=A0ABP8EUB2_9MICO